MKVVFVNHSDVRGGASVVTMRLVKALRQAGVDARMLVGRIEGEPDCQFLAQVHPQWRLKASFLAEHAEIFLRNGFSRANLFKASIATVGMPLHRHRWIKDADVVVLAWVNQGMISLDEVRRIHKVGKRIVWVMHDMWCLTGVCHHAGKCTNYKEHCGHCPLMHGATARHDLSWSTFGRKLKLYNDINSTFVAVSGWLAGKSAESALLGRRDLRVIPNVFPIEEYDTTPALTRRHLGVDEELPLIVFGAARIDDPIKGLPLAIDALNTLHDKGVKAQAVFFGAMKNASALDALRLPYVHLGSVADSAVLKALYAHATVVISSSLYETLPGTVIEGMAAGAWAVTFDRGGQTDIIYDGITGDIVPFGDTQAMASAIANSIAGECDRRRQHDSIAELFGADVVVRLWQELLSEQK